MYDDRIGGHRVGGLVNFKTDGLKPCICGFKPDHYSMAYGRTPYTIFCEGCKKQGSGFGGDPEAPFRWWNMCFRFGPVGEYMYLSNGVFNKGILDCESVQGGPTKAQVKEFNRKLGIDINVHIR